MEITSEIIDVVGKSFSYDEAKKIKTRPHRIKFMGKFITTGSNKTIWRNKGFAKLALINHFETNDKIIELIKQISKENKFCYSNETKELIKKLEADGYIEYAEVDLDGFAVSKK